MGHLTARSGWKTPVLCPAFFARPRVFFSASTARFAPRWAHSHEFHFCPCEECNLRYDGEVVIKLFSPAQAGFFRI